MEHSETRSKWKDIPARAKGTSRGPGWVGAWQDEDNKRLQAGAGPGHPNPVVVKHRVLILGTTVPSRKG